MGTDLMGGKNDAKRLLAPAGHGAWGGGGYTARPWPWCPLTDENCSQVGRAGSLPGS